MDPYYLPHPYLLSPHAKTADLVTHPNGAVVPSDTVSVQAARAGHLATKALGWPYVHYLGKREADADPYYLYGGYGYPPAITSIGAFTTYTNGAVVPTNTPAVAAATASYLQAKAADYAAHGYGYGLLYGRKKREAEYNPEADPYYYYGLYGHHPWVTSVGGLTTYSNGAVVPTDPANQAATAAHLAYKGAHYGYGYPYFGYGYWG